MVYSLEFVSPVRLSVGNVRAPINKGVVRIAGTLIPSSYLQREIACDSTYICILQFDFICIINTTKGFTRAVCILSASLIFFQSPPLSLKKVVLLCHLFCQSHTKKTKKKNRFLLFRNILKAIRRKQSPRWSGYLCKLHFK